MLITWTIHKANCVLSSEALLANSISVERMDCQQGTDRSYLEGLGQAPDHLHRAISYTTLCAHLPVSHTLDKIWVYFGILCQNPAKLFSFNPSSPFRPPLGNETMEAMFQPPDCSRSKTGKYFENIADPI